MRHLRKRLLRAAAAVAGVVVAGMVTAGSSMASTIYFYTGPKFTDASGVYTKLMSISGSLTLDVTLGGDVTESFVQQRNGTTGTFANLLGFSITDGVNDVTLSNSTDWGITLTTDSFGNISDWHLDLQKFNRDNPSLLFNVGIKTTTETDGGGEEFANTGTPGTFRDLGIASNKIQSGTWTVTLVPAIPLPAAFPLFGTGLGILGFLGWRRRRKLAQAV